MARKKTFNILASWRGSKVLYKIKAFDFQNAKKKAIRRIFKLENTWSLRRLKAFKHDLRESEIVLKLYHPKSSKSIKHSV
jgi:hypothetical protein